jgi:N-acetylmuramic acid 6-phosphate etherase
MSESAANRSQDFLRIADQFRLGDLVTEASHPVTRRLSEVADVDVQGALRLLFQVDADVLQAYRQVVSSGRMERMADEMVHALESGGRIFFTGCGSTGRLSILLDSMWRDFWKRQGSQSVGQHAAEGLADRTVSVMAGGDFALIRAVEGFEDYAAFGRKQMRDLGVAAGDVVLAITEGGETSFVIGTAWEGLAANARVWFIYNNPDEVLGRHVARSREVIEEDRIEKLNLTTGPMAISGSTRMQATTIQLCVLATVLEIVVRHLTGQGSEEGKEAAVAFLEGLQSLQQTLATPGLLAGLASVVEREASAYGCGGRANYHADHLAIDVLTDTTERSPTFCTPAFKKVGDDEAAESMAFLFLPGRTTRQAWTHLLQRSPRCLTWTTADVQDLLPKEKVAGVMATLRGITEEELMRFAIGTEGRGERPLRPHDVCLTILADEDLGTALEVEAHAAEGAAGRMLHFTRMENQGEARTPWLRVSVPGPRLLLDGLTRVAVKQVLNAVSTCVMVRLGRVMGNTMIHVVPSNLKLIDRATRYIARLTGLDYSCANRQLFEAIEHVEPRMQVGQAVPPVVGLAVLAHRHGLTLDEAERRLATGGKHRQDSLERQ